MQIVPKNKIYIGIKKVLARPMSKEEFEKTTMATGAEETKGYLVTYADGYESWSPKDVFDAAYFNVENDDYITDADLLNFVSDICTYKLGTRTTAVVVTLVNGYELTATSVCSDEKMYNHEVGAKIATDKVKRKIYELLGFFLQTAKQGLVNKKLNIKEEENDVAKN